MRVLTMKAVAAGLLLLAVVVRGQAGDEGEGDDDKNGTATEPDGGPTTDAAVAAKLAQLLAAYNPALAPGQAAIPKYETRVYLATGIYALIDVDLSASHVVFSYWSVLTYADPRLKFSSNDVNGLKSIIMKESQYREKRFWNPGLYLYSLIAMEPLADTRVQIYSNEERGKHNNRNVLIQEKTVSTIAISPMVRLFPFDKQIITFTWGVEGDDSVAKLALSKRFAGHSIWGASNLNAGPLICRGNHSVCWGDTLDTAVWSTGSYTTVSQSIVLTRTWPTYFMTWILPMQLIWFISYSTYFQDPIGEGGRDGISITAFLAMIFYQVEIKSKLPHVDYVTWIEAYLFCYTMMSGWACIVYVMVVLYFRDNNAYDHLVDGESIEDDDGGSIEYQGTRQNDVDKREKVYAVKVDILMRYGILIFNVALNLGSFIFIYCYYNSQATLGGW